MAQILLKVPISVCHNAMQCMFSQEYHKVQARSQGGSEEPPSWKKGPQFQQKAPQF